MYVSTFIVRQSDSMEVPGNLYLYLSSFVIKFFQFLWYISFLIQSFYLLLFCWNRVCSSLNKNEPVLYPAEGNMLYQLTVSFWPLIFLMELRFPRNTTSYFIIFLCEFQGNKLLSVYHFKLPFPHKSLDVLRKQIPCIFCTEVTWMKNSIFTVFLYHYIFFLNKNKRFFN